MKADQRRRIADYVAEKAVDKMNELQEIMNITIFPEELLEVQIQLEDEIYCDLADTKRFGP